jgi:hypothetical protein
MQTTGPIVSLSSQVGIDSLIYSDKFLELAKNLGVPYIKRDFLFRGGVWRGVPQRSIFFRGRDVRLAIIGHGDRPTSLKTQRILKVLGVQALFGSNLYPIDGFSESIPLGLTNPTRETSLHPIFGEVGHFDKAWEQGYRVNSFDGSALVGFSANTNSDRGKLLKMLSSEQHGLKIIYHEMEFTDAGRIDFLAKARFANMVLCPEGNGFDTHRFWETLYMGGIPVVVKNPFLDTFFDNVPCVKLNTWNELADTKLIESLWHSANNKKWDSLFLSFDYWREVIKNSALN